MGLSWKQRMRTAGVSPRAPKDRQHSEQVGVVATLLLARSFRAA
jgi:hypothetical protein